MDAHKEYHKKIRLFIEEGDEFFTNWMNGTIEKSAISRLDKLLHDNLRIMYTQNPTELVTKDQLIFMIDSYYGRSKDNPIGRKNEYQMIKDLGETLLVSYLEHTTHQDDIIRSRPLSIIVTREPMRLRYSHE